MLILYTKKKLVLWSDIKYIKIKKAEDNNICSIVFFDCHRKKLLHLSSSVVGLTQIAKKAKRKQIPPYHK